MGVIKEYRCPSCHGVWRVRIGHGMMHGDFQRVLKEFPDGLQRKILKDAGGEPDPLFKFNYRAAACPACQRIVAAPEIYLHKTDRTYHSGCPACGTEAVFIEDDSQVGCPLCKEGTLKAQQAGRWD